MKSAPPLIPTIDAGGGRIILRSHGSNVAFSELSATYPLKLLSPRTTQDGVAIVYVLSYGGGLVGGDNLQLFVDVGPGGVLVLLSQGSTKVFKTRQGNRATVQSGSSFIHNLTTQSVMDVVVSDKSSLFLLPDPVTCFRSASYNQVQTFHLSGDASAVLLDWLTSGRKSLGEEWVFSRYYSVNEVWVNGERIARDVLLLEDQEMDVNPLPPRSLKERLTPYSCYATLILYGSEVRDTIHDINAQYDAISVFKTNNPADLIWSLSPISEGAGCIVRVAGKETESVKKWLRNSLQGLEKVIGIDTFRKTFT